MSSKLLAVAVLGMVAGCAEQGARPSVPGAPTSDPEGAVLTATAAATSSAQPKMSCGAKGSCTAKGPAKAESASKQPTEKNP